MTWSSGSWKTVYLNLVVLQNSRWIYFDNCTIEAAVRLVTFFPNLIMLLKFSLGWWLIIDDSNVERTVLCADGDGPDRYLHAGSVIIDSMSPLVIFFVINTTTIIMNILTRRKTLQRYLDLVASVGTRNAFGTSSSTESLPRYFYLYFIKVFVLIWTYICICAFRLPMLFLGSRWCLWWSPPSACASTPSLPSKSWTTTGISRCWQCCHNFHHSDHDNTKGQPTPGDDRDDLYRLVFSRVCASATWRSQ